MGEIWGVDPAAFTGEQIINMGLPEALILGLTETFYVHFESGMNESEVVQSISNHFHNIPLADGTYPPSVPSGTKFLSYLRTFMDAVTRGGVATSTEAIISHVTEIKKFYNR